jgi:N-acetylmuramoyl-L-alanine amidase
LTRDTPLLKFVVAAVMILALAACDSSTPPTPTAVPPPPATATLPPTLTPLPTGTATATATTTATSTPQATTTSTPLPVAVLPTLTPPARRTPADGSYERAPRPLVVLDAGHGGSETGAASGKLIEKDLNLTIALSAAAALRARGIDVVLTRASDRQVTPGGDVNNDGTVDVDDDLQARVDLANRLGAWVMVSVHNNAEGSAATRGTTTYYCTDGLNPVASRALADTLHAHLLDAITAAGYADVDRGVRDDYELRKPEGHLYLLGPHNKRITRPSQMPGALGETLFLTNPADRAQLARPAMLTAIGEGYAAGIAAYLQTLGP